MYVVGNSCVQLSSSSCFDVYGSVEDIDFEPLLVHYLDRGTIGGNVFTCVDCWRCWFVYLSVNKIS